MRGSSSPMGPLRFGKGRGGRLSGLARPVTDKAAFVISQSKSATDPTATLPVSALPHTGQGVSTWSITATRS